MAGVLPREGRAGARRQEGDARGEKGRDGIARQQQGDDRRPALSAGDGIDEKDRREAPGEGQELHKTDAEPGAHERDRQRRRQDEGGDGAEPRPAASTMLERLERTIEERKTSRPSGSYVAGLLAAGEPAMCRKIGEEATEVITAALGGEGDRRVTEEVADLWFHTLVLLGARGIPLREVLKELARRHAARPAPDR